MSDVFSKMHPEDFLGLTSILATAIVILACFIAYQWRRVRVSEMDAALKQDMIQKGMSVEDIERVLRVTPIKPTKQVDVSPAGLAAHMAGYQYEAEDIQKVLRAIGDRGAPLTPEEMKLVRKMVADWAETDAIECAIRAQVAHLPSVEPVRARV